MARWALWPICSRCVTTLARPVMTPAPPATTLALPNTTPVLLAMTSVPPAMMPVPTATLATMATGYPSLVWRELPPQLQEAVNRQINLELYASYVAFYFDRLDVPGKHLGPFFLWHSRAETDQAEMLMKLQKLRGGRICLRDIRKPDCQRWDSGLKALTCALYPERNVNQSLLNLHHLASSKNDAHLCDFLERHYLGEPVKSIKELGDYITTQRKLRGSPESSLAEYFFDKLTLDDRDKN